jgi:acetyl esterase/lipase
MTGLFTCRQQPSGGEPQTILLWEGDAPGALGTGKDDKPWITVHPVARRRTAGTAIIVVPGGAYRRIALGDDEQRQVARWLNALGVTAFELKYRLGPRYRHPAQLDDIQRAIRLVRARASEFGVLPDRVGIMGFSAGGHLAATAGTRFDDGRVAASDPIERVSGRPDFMVLAYPVISFVAPYSHQSSIQALLGDHPDAKLRESLSAEYHVTAQTPPTFLFTTSEDMEVPAENSIAFYLALHRAGVSTELHVFEKGPHGVGLALGNPVLREWPKLLAAWLGGRGLLAQ